MTSEQCDATRSMHYPGIFLFGGGGGAGGRCGILSVHFVLVSDILESICCGFLS